MTSPCLPMHVIDWKKAVEVAITLGKKEESFALKDPLTGCRVYMGLSKIDAELVSRQIEKIFESDQPQLIRTSVIRQF